MARIKISARDTIARLQQLERNRAPYADIQRGREMRVGITRARLDCGEHIMRVPDDDFRALVKIFPGLMARDAAEKSAEIERFFKSDYSLPYRVARTPSQVLRGGRKHG